MGYYLVLGLKRIKYFKVRSLILCSPIVLIVSILFSLTNWLAILQSMLEAEILEPAQQQQTLFTTQITQNEQSSIYLSDRPTIKPIPTDLLKQIESIKGIKSTSPMYSVAYEAMTQIDGLAIDGTTSSIVSLNESMAQLFGVDAFTYTPGSPTPIIAGRDIFTEEKLDFNGQDAIKIPVKGDQQSASDRQSNPEKVTFHKELMNNKLVGRLGQIVIRLTPANPTYVYEQQLVNGEYVDVYSKITTSQVSEFKSATTSVFSQYWDRSKLPENIKIPIVIVGINKSIDRSISYIPENAVFAINQQVQDLYKKARNDIPIPSTLLKRSSGILLSDGTVKQQMVRYYDSRIYKDSLDRFSTQLPIISQYISGYGDGIVLKEASSFNYSKSTLNVDQLMIELSSAEEFDYINEMFTNMHMDVYGDQSKGLYESIIGNILPLASSLTLLLIILTSICLSVLCWLYAKDSVHEIGILRSLGLSSSGAKRYILIQIATLSAASILLGFLLGVLIVNLGAPSVVALIDTQTTLSKTLSDYNLVLTARDFSAVSWQHTAPLVMGYGIIPILFGLLATINSTKRAPLIAMRKSNI